MTFYDIFGDKNRKISDLKTFPSSNRSKKNFQPPKKSRLLIKKNRILVKKKKKNSKFFSPKIEFFFHQKSIFFWGLKFFLGAIWAWEGLQIADFSIFVTKTIIECLIKVVMVHSRGLRHYMIQSIFTDFQGFLENRNYKTNKIKKHYFKPNYHRGSYERILDRTRYL